MPQLFGGRASTGFRAAVIGIPVLLAGVLIGLNLYWRSDYVRNVGRPAAQPIPFPHELHVAGLGIDCRFCHSSVERAADAGMPSAQTCLTCHSEVWAGLALFEPLRTSVALGLPVVWQSVHKLPDFAFFHHGIHVEKGVACETCHGRVDQMARTVKAEPISMAWCLDCHRDPAPRLRPPGDVFTMGWKPDPSLPIDHPEISDDSLRRLTDCTTCHK